MRQKDYAGYLIDLDGTMYNGKEAIAEAADFVQRLRAKNKSFLFLTNNSTALPKDVCSKLENISNVEAYPEETFTSAEATILYLKEIGAQRLYVIGEAGLIDGLKAARFDLVNSFEEEVDAVVVGADRQLDFRKLETATLLIRAGAKFIGTNPDTNIPTEKGLSPGNGSTIAFLEASSGQKATIIGKPEAIIMNESLKKLGLEKAEVLMVGDNYTTDIQAGIRNGIDTLLVLTGFTSKEEIPNLPTPPTYVVETLDDWTI